MTEAGLRKAFRTLIVRLMAEGKVEPGLTLHGRRRTLGDALMELGGDPDIVRAVLGQKSISASLHYSAGASRKRAASAAITLLANARSTKLQTSPDKSAKP
jgi:integrase